MPVASLVRLRYARSDSPDLPVVYDRSMRSVARITGGEALVRSLEINGVRQVFGIPGVQLDHAADSVTGDGGVPRPSGAAAPPADPPSAG